MDWICPDFRAMSKLRERLNPEKYLKCENDAAIHSGCGYFKSDSLAHRPSDLTPQYSS